MAEVEGEEVDPELEEIERAIRENEAAAGAGANGTISAPVVGEPHRPEHAPKKGPGRRMPPQRRRKGMAETSSSAGTPPSASVIGEPTPAAAGEAAKPGEELDEGGTGTKDAMVVWPRVLEKQKALQYGPDAIGISVARVATGPQKAPRIQMAPIDGLLVAGDANTSPGEALYDYIVSYYHLGSGGPATYHLNFYYRAGGGTIRGSAELPLGDPEVILRQRKAVEQAKYDRAVAAGGYPGPAPMPFVAGFPRSPIGGALAPSPAPIQAPNLNPQENQLLQDLLQKTGFYEGYMKAQKEAGAVAPAAPAAPPPARDPNAKPPGLSDEEWASIQRTRLAKDMGPAIAQAVTASLAGMGFTPEVVAGMKGNLQAVPLQPPPAPVTAMDALNEALKLIESATKFKEKLIGMLPEGGGDGGSEKEEKEDDPLKMKPTGIGEMAYGPKLEDESWPDYLIRWGTHNPGAMQQIMAKAAQILDPQTIQKVVMAIAERGAKKGGGGGVGGAPAPAALQGGGEAPKKGWVPD